MPDQPELWFTLPDGGEVTTRVHTVLNAGYAGREQASVAGHIAKLAELGVPAPAQTPALYPVAPTSPARPTRSPSSTTALRERPNGRW